jgi:hypothetical protein
MAVAFALLAATVLISSCGGTSDSSGGPSVSTSAPAAPPRVGKPIRMRAGATTLVVTPRRVSFPLRGSGVLLSPGDRAAGVEITVRNVGHGVYDSSSESDVALRASDAELAQPSFASEGPCATTEIDFLKDVQPGESRSGCVVFDVPKGARPAAVRFALEGRQASGRSWLVGR